MDHMRRDEIVAELEGYQHKIRLGFSSVTVGDVVQLISEVERQAKEISKHREHIGDLQGRLWSVKGTRDQARKDRDRLDKGWCEAVQKLSEVRADRNEAQGRIVELEQERDAALAEVERLKAAVSSPDHCDKCGTPLSTQELQFCMDCRE